MGKIGFGDIISAIEKNEKQQDERTVIEEIGEEISLETFKFIKRIEDEAYPEEMKMMQDVFSVEEFAEDMEYDISELTIIRGKDWYIVYGESDDSIEIIDIASSKDRDVQKSRLEMQEYLTKNLNQRAIKNKKNITLSARETTSYKTFKRMVAAGYYEILEDYQHMWDYGSDIVMHDLVLKPLRVQNRDNQEENNNETR